MSYRVDVTRGRFLDAAAAVARARLGRLYGDAAERPALGGELNALAMATAWVNSPPLTGAALRGKVVLVDMGTYTCINWLRTLPYVRAWAAKYRAHGLVVISVHAPAFSFEADVETVRKAITTLNLVHPIAIDNAFSICSAFKNRYWPSRYLTGAGGRIRHRHFGEGEYESTERAIQSALADAGSGDVGGELVSVAGRGIEADAEWDSLRSRETHLGYDHSENFALSDRLTLDKRHIYTGSLRLRPDRWALVGDWTVMHESAALNRANGQISFSFHARDLHLVMGPVTRGAIVRFRVRVDDEPPGGSAGGDVDARGYGTLSEPRLYQLIRQPQPIVDRQFTIEFLDAGAEAFAFTFG